MNLCVKCDSSSLSMYSNRDNISGVDLMYGLNPLRDRKLVVMGKGA